MHTIITIIIIIISCSITGRPVLFGSGKTKSETLIFKSRGTERRLHLNLHGPIPHSNSNKQMNKYYLEGWLTHKVGQRCDTATGQKHPTARRGPLSDCPVSDPPASLLPAPYNMPPVSVQDTDHCISAEEVRKKIRRKTGRGNEACACCAYQYDSGGTYLVVTPNKKKYNTIIIITVHDDCRPTRGHAITLSRYISYPDYPDTVSHGGFHPGVFRYLQPQ